MKKGNTVYEDKAEKEAKRRQREEEYRVKHTVSCPYCKKDVLDHMTKCPSCGKPLKPTGYTPMSKKKILIIRGIAFVVGMIVVGVLFYFLYK
jgi:ribosomal protein L37AE/L43A